MCAGVGSMPTPFLALHLMLLLRIHGKTYAPSFFKKLFREYQPYFELCAGL